MTLVPSDESKDTLKKYEELWDRIRDLIRLITNRFNLDDDLALNKKERLYNVIISVRSSLLFARCWILNVRF